MREPNDILIFVDRQEWRDWLETHHADRDEAWLRHTKKGARKPGLSYEEAVEEALCYGWMWKRLTSSDFRESRACDMICSISRPCQVAGDVIPITTADNG